MLQLDYEQSPFFLGPSSKTPETRKWPRAWLKVRDGFSSLIAAEVAEGRFEEKRLPLAGHFIFWF